MTIYFLLPRTFDGHIGLHGIFLKTVLYLKEKYSANVVYSENSDYVTIEKLDHQMRDCELIIDDEENDRLIVISICESRNFGNGYKNNDIWDVLVKRNNKNDIILIAHYSSWFHKDRDFSKEYNFKVLTMPFYTFKPWIDNDYFYELRKLRGTENLIDKIFYFATTNRFDPYKLYELGYATNPDLRYSGQEYLDLATKYKVGLAISSAAELCYREIDYMGVGLPTLRLEYMVKTNPPLIPNYHYIAIDREKHDLYGPKDDHNWNPAYDRTGGEKYVNAYIERFNEVRNDHDFLAFISKNGYDYYRNYCSPENKLKHIISLINL